MHFLKYL